eukprot:SAG31_NODE_3762_length_3905_cov_1.808460_1_plen_788_part_10
MTGTFRWFLCDLHHQVRIARDSALTKQLMLAVIGQLNREKKSLQLRVDKMFLSLLSLMSFSSCKPLIRLTLPEHLRQHAPPQETIDIAATAAASEAERAEKDYLLLIAELESMCVVAKTGTNKDIGSSGTVHWKQRLISQAGLTFCCGSGPCRGSTPEIGTSSRLVANLVAPDYLARRLAVVSATVIAGLNCKAAIQVACTEVERPLNLATLYALPPPQSPDDWNAAEFFDADAFDYGDPNVVNAAGAPTDQQIESDAEMQPVSRGMLTVKTLAAPQQQSGLQAEELGAVGFGVLVADRSSKGGGDEHSDKTSEKVTNGLSEIVDLLIADHRSNNGEGATGALAIAGVAEAFLSALYRRAPSNRVGFSFADACLWQKLFRLGGFGLWREHVVPLLASLITSSDRDKQAVAAEIVAGVVRGSKYWGFAEHEALWTGSDGLLNMIWDVVIKSAIGDILQDWCAALDFLLNRRDPRRFWWFTEWLGSCSLHSETDTKQCVAVLTLIEAVLNATRWRSPRFLASAWDHCQRVSLAHPFKQVRVEIGRVAAHCLSYGAAETQQAAVQLFKQYCKVADEQASAGDDASDVATNVDKALGFVEIGSNGEDEDTAIRRLTNARETLLWCVTELCRSHSSSSSVRVKKITRMLLPEVLAAHSDVDPDLRAMAFSCATSMAHLHLNATEASEIYAELGRLQKCLPWRARLALIIFAQAVAFRSFLTAPPSGPTNMDKGNFSLKSAPLLGVLEKGLLDDRPETQERAVAAYSQLVPALPPQAVEALLKKFAKLSKTELP